MAKDEQKELDEFALKETLEALRLNQDLIEASPEYKKFIEAREAEVKANSKLREQCAVLEERARKLARQIGHSFSAAGYSVIPYKGYDRVTYDATGLDESLALMRYLAPGMAEFLESKRKVTAVQSRVTIQDKGGAVE